MQTFDAIVLGLGTMGAFTCLELSQRGLQVAGIDRLSPPHSSGSHSGDTRVFRIAYAEHPDYVPLAQRAASLWGEHGKTFNKTLLTQSGMLSLGSPSGPLISGITRSASLHRLDVESIPIREIRTRFPSFEVPEHFTGVFEKDAGWLDVQASIAGALSATKANGATLLLNTPVSRWKRNGGRFIVETPDSVIEASNLVITAGAGAVSLLRELRLPIVIWRKVLTWLEPRRPELFSPDVFPVFAIDDEFFYGFPNIANQGVKVAVHWQKGIEVDDPLAPVPPASESDYVPVLQTVNRYFPDLVEPLPEGLSRVRRGATCLYAMTPDEHFILDRHPFVENLWFTVGFSGHGFKFAPAIAEAVAQLVTEGRTGLSTDFLRIGHRFPIVST